MNIRLWQASRRRLVSASLLAAMAAMVIACGGAGNRKNAKAVADTTDAVKVSAVELYRAYKDNEVAAKKKYTDKVLEVTGTVHGVKDGYVELNEDDGPFQVGMVHITPDDASKERLASLTKGQTIRVRGYCKGKGFAAVNVENAVFLDDSGKDGSGKSGDTPPKSGEKDAAAVQVSAVELFKAFKENEAAANKKYKGKTVQVRGTVHSVKSRYVELDEDNSRFLLGLVHVTLTGDSKDKMESLKKGQSIEVRGVCTGKSFASVDIKDAVLLD